MGLRLDNGTWVITNQSELIVDGPEIYVEVSCFEVRKPLPSYDIKFVDLEDLKARVVTRRVLMVERFTYSIGIFIVDNRIVASIDTYISSPNYLVIPKYRHEISVRETTLGELAKDIQYKIFSEDTQNCVVGLIDAHLNYGESNYRHIKLILNGLHIFNNFYKGSKAFTHACLNQTFPDYWHNQFCNPHLSFGIINYNKPEEKTVYVRLRKKMEDTDSKAIATIFHDQRVGKYLFRLNKHIGKTKGKFWLPPYYMFSNKLVDIDVSAYTKGILIPSVSGEIDYYLPSTLDLDCYNTVFDEVIFSRDNDGRTGKYRKNTIRKKTPKYLPINPKEDSSLEVGDGLLNEKDIDIQDLTEEEYNLFLPEVQNFVSEQYSLYDSIKSKKEVKISSDKYQTEYKFLPNPEEPSLMSFSSWYGGLEKGNIASIDNEFRTIYNFDDLVEDLKTITKRNDGTLRFLDLTYSILKHKKTITRVIIPSGTDLDSIPNDFFVSRMQKKYRQGRLAIIIEINLYNKKFFLIDFEPKQDKQTVMTLIKLYNEDERDNKRIINILFEGLSKYRLVREELNNYLESFEDITNHEFMVHKKEDPYNYFLSKMEKLIDDESFSSQLEYIEN